MGIFRSEEILHKKIRIPRESSMEIVEGLGELKDTLEFIDLNIDDIEAKKYYVDSIKRIDKIEKKIKNIYRIFEKYNVKSFSFKKYENFKVALIEDQDKGRNFGTTYFDLVENFINDNEKKLVDFINYHNGIRENLEELLDKKFLWKKAFQLINNVQDQNIIIDNNEINVNSDIENRIFNLKIIAGIINADEEIKFKKMIFRTTKGLAYPNIFSYEDDDSQGNIRDKNSSNYVNLLNNREKNPKKIFVLCIHGEGLLMHKVLKICDLIRASRFNIPGKEDFHEELKILIKEIDDKQILMLETENSIRKFLNEKDENNNFQKLLNLYKFYLIRERFIYSSLNKCLVRDSFIDAEIWIRKNKLNSLRNFFNEFSLRNENSSSACIIDLQPTHLTPPTFLETNDFIKPFQEIVNTYSIPNYREINPACFIAVTFPFLFGVMFGDMGHGIILFLFGVFIIIFLPQIKSDKNSYLANFSDYRFIILLFGLFSFYSGLIYNEFFSIPIPLFRSCYQKSENFTLSKKEECIYPIGVDPQWNLSTNELNFLNSMKMKISIIIGVLHMMLGILLSGINFFNREEYIYIFTVFFPKILFMGILFGYLSVMIVIKWLTNWQKIGLRPPSIINQFLNIFLRFGEILDTPLYGEQYNKKFQENVHSWLFISLLILIPVMWIPKPIYDYLKEKNNKKSRRISSNSNEELSMRSIEINNVLRNEPHLSQMHDFSEILQHEDSFMEIFIDHSIEIIEFILGSVSNTASYLRLWALSLAHSQLSKVFFEKILLKTIQNGEIFPDFIILFFCFIIFANVTLGVLMSMDLMECFLHTLRLHWVEFMNKFYKGDGYKFEPFYFKRLIKFN